MGIHLEFYGSSVGFCWEFICGSLEFIGGHWRLLENCLGFIWSSIGVIWISLGVIGGYWVVVGVQLEYVGSSFVVHLVFIEGHWRFLENCLGFSWSSIG